MKRKRIDFISLEDLKKLSTKQLLSRLNRLHQCEQSLELSDCQADKGLLGGIEFKDSKEWIVAYQQLKEILAIREHIIKDVPLIQRKYQRATVNKSLQRGYRKV